MSNAIYPSAVRGLTFPVTKTAEGSIIFQDAPNFYSTRIRQADNPRWHWELIYNYLKDDPEDLVPSLDPHTDYRVLQGFWLAHENFDDFLYLDPTDNTVADQELPLVTDGAGTWYSPIQRNFGGQFLEDITDLYPAGGADLSSLTVSSNGIVQTSNYTIIGPGVSFAGYGFEGLVIQWAAEPVAPITASFSFYFRCLFETDKQGMDQFMGLLWTAGGEHSGSGASVKLMSAKTGSI